MTSSGKNIDQGTRILLQRATVKTLSKEFTPRLMKMIEQERGTEQSTLAERLFEEKKPWAVYAVTGICLIISAVLTFLLLNGVLSDISLVSDTMQKNSTFLVDYSRIFYLSLQEYFLIPIVINAICILILLDYFLRKRTLQI